MGAPPEGRGSATCIHAAVLADQVKRSLMLRTFDALPCMVGNSQMGKVNHQIAKWLGSILFAAKQNCAVRCSVCMGFGKLNERDSPMQTRPFSLSVGSSWEVRQLANTVSWARQRGNADNG